jgi:hypothetical protein
LHELARAAKYSLRKSIGLNFLPVQERQGAKEIKALIKYSQQIVD